MPSHRFIKCLKERRFGVDTVWKVCKYGIFSGPYFPPFGLNTENYGPEKTPHLDTFRAVDLIWEDRLFQIFGLKTLKLLSPYFTWFGLVTLRFKAFCFDFFENDNLKMLVIRLVIVLYISKHRQCNVTIFIVIFFAMFKTWEWLLSTSLHNSC